LATSVSARIGKHRKKLGWGQKGTPENKSWFGRRGWFRVEA